jgi:hypothetical protein
MQTKPDQCRRYYNRYTQDLHRVGIW